MNLSRVRVFFIENFGKYLNNVHLIFHDHDSTTTKMQAVSFKKGMKPALFNFSSAKLI